MAAAWLWLTNFPVLRGDIFLLPLALVMVLPASTLEPLHHTTHIIPYYISASILWNVSACVDDSIL